MIYNLNKNPAVKLLKQAIILGIFLHSTDRYGTCTSSTVTIDSLLYCLNIIFNFIN